MKWSLFGLLSRSSVSGALVVLTASAIMLVPVRPASAAAFFDYVQLGDSYSAGTGAGQYINNNSDRCYRSGNSYAQLLTRDLARRGVLVRLNIQACNGGETHNITGQNATGGPPQIDAVNPDTDLVTISIGGNDLGFGPKVRRCIDSPLGRCGLLPGQPLVDSRDLERVRLILQQVYRRILEKMSPGGRLVVLSYPAIFPDRIGGCTLSINATITDEELNLIGSAWIATRDMIRTAVSEVAKGSSRIRFIDMQDAFRGNRICEIVPNLANEIVPSDSLESFHPNQFGHLRQANILIQSKVPF